MENPIFFKILRKGLKQLFHLSSRITKRNLTKIRSSKVLVLIPIRDFEQIL